MIMLCSSLSFINGFGDATEQHPPMSMKNESGSHFRFVRMAASGDREVPLYRAALYQIKVGAVHVEKVKAHAKAFDCRRKAVGQLMSRRGSALYS